MSFLRCQQWMLFAFAIALQIQITLFAQGNYQGLRISLADFLLPVGGLFVLISLILRKSKFPQWLKPFGYWALFLLTAILALSAFNGYLIHGEWSRWAILNKGIGWIVLMGYLGFGAWLSGHLKPEGIPRYLVFPSSAFLLILTVGEVFMRLFLQDIKPFTSLGITIGADLSGLMGNRNAFAFLYLSFLILSGVFLIKAREMNKNQAIIFYALWFLTPIMMALNLSRSFLIVLIPVLICIAFVDRRLFLKRLLPLIIAGSLLIPFASMRKIDHAMGTFSTIEKSVDHINAGDRIEPYTPSEKVYVGDRLRMNVLNDSFELIKKHPITGAGLGSILSYQDEKDRKHTSVMDNTLLWILTEMGPLGLIGFLGVYISMLLALLKKGKGDNDAAVFAHAMFFVMLGFGAFSMFHEILYSRFLWFFLGIGLVIPYSCQTEAKTHHPQ